MVAAAGAQVQVLDSRRLGGAWVMDQVWGRVGIGAAIRRVAQHRRLDADLVERVLVALVAQRALEPASKLAGTRWVTERVAIEGLRELGDDQAYRGMDVLLDALPEVAGEIFGSVAHLLKALNIVFVDSPANRKIGTPSASRIALYRPIRPQDVGVHTSPRGAGRRRFLVYALAGRRARRAGRAGRPAGRG